MDHFPKPEDMRLILLAANVLGSFFQFPEVEFFDSFDQLDDLVAVEELASVESYPDGLFGDHFVEAFVKGLELGLD